MLRKPTPRQIDAFIARREQADYTYDAVGATRTAPPPGYRVDQTRCRLGSGEAAFAAACDALRRWAQFDLGWLRLYPAAAPISTGTTVAIVASAAGQWWLNACRIVYVIDEADQETCRFGFAYGTLPGHAGSGEERFLVELNSAGEVAYEIFAFSRPGHFLARIGYPLLRRYQRCFGRDSTEAMRRAIAR